MLNWRRQKVGAIESSIQAFRDFAPNGCTWSPDKIPFVGWFGDCCDVHDFLYWAGGAEADRLRADRQLRDCMRAKVAHEGWAKRAAMRWVSWRYYRYVRRFGGSHFNYWDKARTNTDPPTPRLRRTCKDGDQWDTWGE